MFILMLVMVELEEGVGRIGKDVGKKLIMCCFFLGGCFVGCIVVI